MTNPLPIIYKKLNLLLVVLLSVFLLMSCRKNIPFENSSVVPAAQGNVSIKMDDNKNYSIHVKITNLAEAKRLQPSKSVYIIWINTEENTIKNIGQIKTEKGFVSSKLEGKFETVTSFKPTKVFITAEDTEFVEFPGNQIILETKIFEY
ncbi:hypothetical protein RCH18_001397 [Flavobacterium sp. PL11]|uniref:hypothetical protein n=1 Tax=Flavobacterium sp. PL11 TaxID=3071717 RepID=UPI002DFA54ED|nr:hypothetical protein [Flavobacterium sp. PL11]